MKIKKYLAAISGGPDSMALLHKYRFQIKLVCHVNFHTKEDSTNDANTVETYCKKYKITFYLLDATKDVYDKYSHINNKEALYRKIRYDLFLKLMKERKIKKLLMGHQLNDHLETALEQLDNNKDPFYYGIVRKSDFFDYQIVRPLIKKTKKQLYDFCLKKNINFGFDYWNECLDYTRNKNRKKIYDMRHKDFLALKKKITKLNKEKIPEYKKIRKTFYTWKKLNYSLNFFLEMKDAKMRQKIIYMFLSKNNISSINKNKIYGIENFIVKGKKNGLYRLTANKKLSKTNFSLNIVSY